MGGSTAVSSEASSGNSGDFGAGMAGGEGDGEDNWLGSCFSTSARMHSISFLAASSSASGRIQTMPNEVCRVM